MSLHLGEVVLDEFWGPFLHQVGVVEDLLRLPLVHPLGQVRNETHSLPLLHEVELHLVYVLKLFEHPSFWLLSLQSLHRIQHMTDYSVDVLESFVGQVYMNFKFRVAIVGIVSSC